MFAAGDVELIGEREGDRAARVRAIAVAVQANDPGNARILAGARDRNLVAELDRAARDVAGTAAEIAIRPGQALHEQAQPRLVDHGSCVGSSAPYHLPVKMTSPRQDEFRIFDWNYIMKHEKGLWRLAYGQSQVRSCGMASPRCPVLM